MKLITFHVSAKAYHEKAHIESITSTKVSSTLLVILFFSNTSRGLLSSLAGLGLIVRVSIGLGLVSKNYNPNLNPNLIIILTLTLN